MSIGTLVALILSTLAMGATVGSFLFLYRTDRRVTTNLSVRDRLHKELVAKVEQFAAELESAGRDRDLLLERIRTLESDRTTLRSDVREILSNIQQFAAELESAGRDRDLLLERIRTLESDRTALRSEIRELSELVTGQRDQMVTDFERLIERVRAVESSRSALSHEFRELRTDVEAAHFGQPNMPTQRNAELSLRDAIDTLPN